MINQPRLGADFLRFLVVVGFFEDYVQRTFKRLTNLLAMKGAGGGLDKMD
jgi:hypothetical protein